MNIIDETRLFEDIGRTRRALLVEPPWKTRHVPLGLARISTVIKKNGGESRYRRVPSMLDVEWADRIFVSSVFSYDSKMLRETLTAITSPLYDVKPIVVGGPFASLMPSLIRSWEHKELSLFAGCSPRLDETPLDREIMWDRPDFDDTDWVMTSRGCPNKCPYCIVNKIEDTRLIPKWETMLSGRAIVSLDDNNLTATPRDHWRHVLQTLSERNVRVSFGNGLDCHRIDEEFATLIGRCRITSSGLRMAFDREGDRGSFGKAVRLLRDAGVPKSSFQSYVLFNFNDTPAQADARCREVQQLGVVPYPMRFTPLDKLERQPIYVGKNWTIQLVRKFRFFWLNKSLYSKFSFDGWMRDTGGSTNWNDYNGHSEQEQEQEVPCLDFEWAGNERVTGG